MKKSLLFFAFLALVFSSCNETTVTILDKPGCTDPNSLNYDPEATIDNGTCALPQKIQMGFVVEYTATWCGPCGANGAPTMHGLYEMGNVIGITAHASGDPMHIPALYNSFNSCRPSGGGIPSFWIGDEKSSSTGTMQALLDRDPTAGVTFTATKSGNSMVVKTLTQFFEDNTGDFYLSVYILESGIDGTSGEYEQNGTSDPEYKHDFVLRETNVPNEVYGEKIATGPVKKNQLVRKDYTIALDPSWDQNVYAVAVLWRKADGGAIAYEFVNGWEWGSHQSH